MTGPQLSPGVAILRRVVITMGFVLVIGVIALFIAVYFKFMHKSEEKYYAVQQPSQIQVQPTKCAFKPVANIEIESNIVSSNINGSILTIITGKKTKPTTVNKVQQGNALTLTAEAPTSSQQIVIYDLCEGIVISRLNVVEEN